MWVSRRERQLAGTIAAGRCRAKLGSARLSIVRLATIVSCHRLHKMPAEWIIPAAGAAGQAVKNRDTILGAWDRIHALVRGRKSVIAITGAQGVGKTVLLQHLSGDAYKPSYAPPKTSRDKEKERVPAKRQRLVVTAVPGQESDARFRTLRGLFEDGKDLHGVIHVVANGFAQARSTTSVEVARAEGTNTIAEYRAAQIEQEVIDLRSTLEVIRRSIQQRNKPLWLIFAVNKVDLYADRDALREAKERYGPDGEVGRELKQFLDKVGTDNVAWDARPVCAWLEDFVWGDERVPTQLTPQQRDHLLAELVEDIEARSRARK